MAKRRSLNRRWSRRSRNATELDPDSEFFDDENPVWWQNLPDESGIRPSTRTSLAETTLPNLTLNSLINDSELQDRWWENLDRTSLQSSRRFSTRKSVNPEDVTPKSFVSEDDNEVSIKKRKVLLRARTKRSIGTENFLKAFEDSDIAHSEPAPSKKRKTQSPPRSEADLIQKKIRTRQSRSLAELKDSSFTTSNDTDVVIKARPKALRKKATEISSDVYDEILSKAQTSEINASKNASRINIPNKTIDSSESGFIRPSITGPHRKRLSTVSKKLDLTSEESDSNTGTIKSRSNFRVESKKNASFNPFDEILSGQLNESTASTEAPNKSGSSSNAAIKSTKNSMQNRSLRISIRRDEEEKAKKAAASNMQLGENERTINRQTLSDQENDRRSISVLKEGSRFSKSRGKNEMGENEVATGELNVSKRLSQNLDRRSSPVMIENERLSKRGTKNATEEFNVPETQENDELSIRRKKHTTIIEESVEIDKESQDRDRRSSVLKKHSGDSKEHTKNATEEFNVPETQENDELSIRRKKHTTIIEESVEIDEESQDTDRRSSILKQHSGDSKRHTKNATNDWNVPETQEDPSSSKRRIKNSMVIEESVDIDKSPESQEKDRRSSSTLKRNSRFSKTNTKNLTIERVLEGQEDPRISISPVKKSMIIGGSMEIDKFSESQNIDRRSSSVLKGNSRISKRRTKDAMIEEEAATDEWELPEIEENSRISMRAVKNSTMIEESVENRDRDRRSSSASNKRLRDSKRRTREATIDEATIQDDELPIFNEKSAKITSTLKQNVRDRKRRTNSMVSKIQTTEHEKSGEKKQIQFFENWEWSASEEENETIKSHESSYNNSHNSLLITKTLGVSISRLSPTKISHIQQTKELEKTSENSKEEKKSHLKLRSSKSRSRNSVDSAYELPDKERSSSLNISASGNESINENLSLNKSTRQSAKNHQDDNRKSVNRSFSDRSRRNPTDSNVSRSRIDFATNLEQSNTKSDLENRTKPIKNLFAKNKIVSTKGIENTSDSQQDDFDQDIDEELMIGSQKSNFNLSRKSSGAEKKANDSRRNESRQEKQFDINKEEHHQSHKSKVTSRGKSSISEQQVETTKSAMPANSSQENQKFTESISEAETEIADDETSTTNREILRANKRPNKSGKNSTQSNSSEKREESGVSISEEEFFSLKQTSNDKSHANRTSSQRSNVSKQRIESGESISEEEANLKSLKQTSNDKSHANRTSSQRSNVSKQRIESGESISEEEANLKSLKQTSNDKSHANRTNSQRLNVSTQHIESDETISEKDANLKSLKQTSNDKSHANRSNSQRLNVSKQRIESGESFSEEEANLKSLKQTSNDKSHVNRTNSQRLNVSTQHIESDETISEKEANLKSLKQTSNDKSHANRTNSQRLNVFKQRIESGESISEEETNLKSLKQTSNDKSHANRTNSQRLNVSTQRIESDESISEEATNLKSLKQTSNDKSHANRTNSQRLNVSTQHIESDESISEKEANLKSLNQPKNQSRASQNNSRRLNISKQRIESDESISEGETNLKSLKQTSNAKSHANRTNFQRLNVSTQHIESDESISEKEANLKSLNQSKNKSRASQNNSRRLNISKQLINSDESINEEEANLKSLNQPTKDKNVTARKNVSHQNLSKPHLKSHANRMKDNTANLENTNQTDNDNTNEGDHINQFVPQASTTRNKSSITSVENTEEDASTSIPSAAIPLAPILTTPLQNSTSLLNKSKKTRTQKYITDFMPSKFLQKKDNSNISNHTTKVDTQKLELLMKEIKKKKREMAILSIAESSKKKESTKLRPVNDTKINKLRAKENAPKIRAKPPKVVDKAYIVNGQVYKRPKLPRPKPWVTDRLYHYLWKRLEPKYNMRTRIKSERFVEQLAEVVALTIRRKKYDSYKAEVDALMKAMARLKIIKTRNDFYDFCYDFLPYDFRVKVTPMILPGSIRNIPYDPATLHDPILPES